MINSSVKWFVLSCLSLLATSVGCSYYIPIKYKISPFIEPREPRSGSKLCQNKNYQELSYANRQKLRADKPEGAYRLSLTVERKIDLLLTARQMGQTQEGAGQRTPAVLPIRLTVNNNRNAYTIIDYYNFQLRNRENGAIYRPLTPELYQQEYYNTGLGDQTFAWLFEQRSNYAFLYPIPEWYYEHRRRQMTSSPAEMNLLKKIRLNSLTSLHQRQTYVRPGGTIAGYLIFPEPLPQKKYILEYKPNEASGSRQAPHLPAGAVVKPFQFDSFCFDIDMIRGKQKSKTARSKTMANESRAQRLEQLSQREQRRNHIEFKMMHQQRLNHYKLKSNLDKQK